MNSFLHKAKMEVEDLFTDLADGRKLLKLLEIISGNTQFKTRVTPSLLSCREFNCCDDTIAWRKSTKEAQRPKFFVVIQKVKISSIICIITELIHAKLLMDPRRCALIFPTFTLLSYAICFLKMVLLQKIKYL